jgi:hypothetical protein
MFRSIINDGLTKYIKTISIRYHIPEDELFNIWNEPQFQINNLIEQLRSIKSDKTIKGNTQNSSTNQSVQVKHVLEKNGFRNIDMVTEPIGLLYKEQPNGSQKSPDFYLINGKKRIALELKKSNTNVIIWNDGFPVKDTLYLISCRDFTRLCIGNQLRTDKDVETYEKLCERIRILNSEFKNQSEFTFYTRKAISQKIKETDFKNDLIDCYSLLNKLFNVESN